MLSAAKRNSLTKALVQQHAAEINAVDEFGWSALMWAVYHQSKDIIACLLQQCYVNVNIQSAHHIRVSELYLYSSSLLSADVTAIIISIIIIIITALLMCTGYYWWSSC